MLRYSYIACFVILKFCRNHLVFFADIIGVGGWLNVVVYPSVTSLG